VLNGQTFDKGLHWTTALTVPSLAVTVAIAAGHALIEVCLNFLRRAGYLLTEGDLAELLSHGLVQAVVPM